MIHGRCTLAGMDCERPRLVSSILATRNRREFLPQALRCFLRQSYANRELIIVDDSDKPAGDLCAGLPGVRYIRLTQPTNTGTKLNIGIEAARGDVLQKIDDDDFYHRDFLSIAEDRLPASGTHEHVVAWCCFLVLFRGDARPRHSGHGWAAGGTLCFHRELWKRHPFRDVPSRVDAWFLFDSRPRMISVCSPEHYILVRHGANTWTQMEGGATDEYLDLRPFYRKPLEALVEPEDVSFYRAFTRPPGTRVIA